MLRTGQERQSAQPSPMAGWATVADAVVVAVAMAGAVAVADAGGGSPTQRPQQIFALI